MSPLLSALQSNRLVMAVVLPFAAFAALIVHDMLPAVDRFWFPEYGPLVLGVAFALSGVVTGIGVIQHRKSLVAIMDAVQAVGHGRFNSVSGLPESGELVDLARSIDWMSTQVRRHVADILEEKEKLSAVLDGIWEGVLVLGPRGRIRGANDSMECIVPGIRDRRGVRPLEVIRSPELQDGCDRLLAKSDQATENLRITLGEDQCYDVNLVRPSESSGLGLIAVFHDISEMEQLRSMRSDFAANVSHELRTPLTSIKGYAETLLSDVPPPPEMAQRFLEVILRNANHMGKMIADLLTLSRIESSQGAAEVEPVDAAIVLAATVEAVESMSAKREVRIETVLPDDLPQVMADPDRLGQVFRNLIENGIKFGPQGSVIHVTAQTQGERNNLFIRFGVRDYGCGIPKAHQDRIFERFYSVEKHRRNEFGSTGLGLSICRHIVRDFGGEIGVQSPPADAPAYAETGTLFTFTVPVAAGAVRPKIRPVTELDKSA